jgi:thiol-disulfide isomerase/thioredoxin
LDEIDQQIELAIEALDKAEQQYGPFDPRLASSLEECAKVLRKKPGRLLEAVNMEAKAKSIRSKYFDTKVPDSEIKSQAEIGYAGLPKHDASAPGMPVPDLSYLQTSPHVKVDDRPHKTCTCCKKQILEDALLCLYCRNYPGGEVDKLLLASILGIIVVAILQIIESLIPITMDYLAPAEVYLAVAIVLFATWRSAKIKGLACLVGFYLTAQVLGVFLSRFHMSLPLRSAILMLLVYKLSDFLLPKITLIDQASRIGYCLAIVTSLMKGSIKVVLAPVAMLLSVVAFVFGERKLAATAVCLAGVTLLNVPISDWIAGKRFVAMRMRMKVMSEDQLAKVPGYLEANADNPGEALDITKLRVLGAYTIVEFSSPYCGPCQAMKPVMAELARRRPDIKVRMVDINREGVEGIDWDSPLATRYDVHSVPLFAVFDPEGRYIADGDEAREQVMTWVREAGI